MLCEFLWVGDEGEFVCCLVWQVDGLDGCGVFVVVQCQVGFVVVVYRQVLCFQLIGECIVQVVYIVEVVVVGQYEGMLVCVGLVLIGEVFEVEVEGWLFEC